MFYRECTRPPSIRVLVDKINNYCSKKGLISGISHKDENYPDKEWLIKAVATLSDGFDEIFDPDYVPSASDIRR